ncbi:thioredoxin domain-containing protein [Candidatus Mycosynbacter amalyticus]|uniref:Thioredoxin domain-containing protein n=1 Tax=Candidatus Mycosynbacter amalyticus TaxID=2665156 RepID=A0A857MNU0_9BACT|nr:DsbA family protein [Candidatus Mycosynbacter amalyticus]QHN42791.1 thioredoxin domain-containing protein [Candidatus Mycosynbacter amalyticus]
MAISRETELQQKKVIIAVAAIVCVVVLAIVGFRMFWQQHATGDTAPAQAPLSVSLGNKSASTKVVIYTDPVCDKCATFHSATVKPLYDDYAKTGKIDLEIRPLSIVTEQSAALTELLMCGNEQGKFMDTSDFVSDALTRSNGRTVEVNGVSFFTDFPAARIAQGAGLDETKLSSCLRDNRYDNLIKQADTQAYAANIYSTPTTFVAGQEPVRGYAIYDYIKSLVDISL